MLYHTIVAVYSAVNHEHINSITQKKKHKNFLQKYHLDSGIANN